MTAAALATAALDEPHEVMNDALTGRSRAILDGFLAKMGDVPAEELEATAPQLMSEVRDRLEDIENPISRAVAAQNLINLMDERTKLERPIRDVSLGVLVWPWHLIQEQYKADLAALDASMGQDDPEYAKTRDAINDKRRRAERRSPWSPGTPWSPKDLAVHGHISRGLINSRVIPRLPSPIPQIREDQLVRESERAGRVLRYISESVAKSSGTDHLTLRDVIERVRNDAIQIMLGSPDEEYEREGWVWPPVDNGRTPAFRFPDKPNQRGLAISNADVARELVMKTSRIAQLRTGNG